MTKTESKWRARIAAWRTSGETAEAFASGKGFEGSTLRWWSSRLSREPRVSATPAASVPMARVVRAPSRPSESSLAVAVGDARVLVGWGFDAALLRDVVAALGGAS